MQRYFIDQPIEAIHQVIVVDEEQAHHIKKVLRMQVGEQVEIVDSNEQLSVAEITHLTPVTIRILRFVAQQVEMPVKATILVGLSKGDKLEWIVQKATELGVYAIVPLLLKRNMVKWTKEKAVKKVERLQKIATEAAEQAHRLHIPIVHPLMSLEEALLVSDSSTLSLVAFEEVAKQGEKAQLARSLQKLKKGDSVAFFFGPEGGLEPNEVAILEERGVLSCSLGPRILRAETAPLYALTALSYQVELVANSASSLEKN